MSAQQAQPRPHLCLSLLLQLLQPPLLCSNLLAFALPLCLVGGRLGSQLIVNSLLQQQPLCLWRQQPIQQPSEHLHVSSVGRCCCCRCCLLPCWRRTTHRMRLACNSQPPGTPGTLPPAQLPCKPPAHLQPLRQAGLHVLRRQNLPHTRFNVLCQQSLQLFGNE